MKLSRLVAVGGALVVLVALTGCAETYVTSRPAIGCVPLIIIEPQEAMPGDVITLSSDTVCDVAQPKEGWAVTAGHVGDGETVHAQTRTDQTFDGSFAVQLELPADFPTGESWAGIANWDYSFCSANASCAAASANFTVQPPR